MNDDQKKQIASSEMAFRLYTIGTLSRVETKVDSVCERTAKLEAEQIDQGKDIAALKVKAGVWGAVMGLISGVLTTLGLRSL